MAKLAIFEGIWGQIRQIEAKYGQFKANTAILRQNTAILRQNTLFYLKIRVKWPKSMPKVAICVMYKMTKIMFFTPVFVHRTSEDNYDLILHDFRDKNYL